MRRMVALARASLIAVGAVALVYGVYGQLAEAQSDGCGIPMLRDETTGVVHLMNGGACPTPPCPTSAGPGTCTPSILVVQGPTGPAENWQVCLCVHIQDNGDGTYTVTVSAPDCVEAFKPFGEPDPPTVGMGKCLPISCPDPCDWHWVPDPQDPEVSSIVCQCGGMGDGR